MSSEWISVNDRLPKYGEAYIFFSYERFYNTSIFTGIFFYDLDNKSDWWFKSLTGDNIFKSDSVSHWMPLLQPPKDDHE